MKWIASILQFFNLRNNDQEPKEQNLNHGAGGPADAGLGRRSAFFDSLTHRCTIERGVDFPDHIEPREDFNRDDIFY